MVHSGLVVTRLNFPPAGLVCTHPLLSYGHGKSAVCHTPSHRFKLLEKTRNYRGGACGPPAHSSEPQLGHLATRPIMHVSAAMPSGYTFCTPAAHQGEPKHTGRVLLRFVLLRQDFSWVSLPIPSTALLRFGCPLPFSLTTSASCLFYHFTFPSQMKTSFM